MLDVGRVTRPHGLRGHVVVELWTNRPERVAPGARLHAAGRVLTVERSSPLGDVGGKKRWLVGFEGVGDRAGAERLRDVVLAAPPINDADAIWVHDLIGSEVVDPSGEPIGVVEAVEANPASDLLVLTDGRLIPLRFVVDRGPGRLTVDVPPGLLEL